MENTNTNFELGKTRTTTKIKNHLEDLEKVAKVESVKLHEDGLYYGDVILTDERRATIIVDAKLVWEFNIVKTTAKKVVVEYSDIEL